MKKLIIFAIIFLGIMIYTCPDKDAHVKALSSEALKSEGLDSNVLTSMFGGALAHTAFDVLIDVNNYFVFSTGVSTTNNEVVSIGVFGHVFVLD